MSNLHLPVSHSVHQINQISFLPDQANKCLLSEKPLNVYLITPSMLIVCFYSTKGGHGNSSRRRHIFTRWGYFADFMQSHRNTKRFPGCKPKYYHGFDAFLSSGHQTLDVFVSHSLYMNNFRGWHICPRLNFTCYFHIHVKNYLIYESFEVNVVIFKAEKEENLQQKVQ